MRKFIAKYIGFPLQDMIKGTRTIKAYNELIRTEKFTSEELEKYQLLKLKKLISYSYNNVQYYRELFDAAGLTTEDIQSLEDMKKIPVTDKAMARNAGQKLYGNTVNKRLIKKGKTGGTTGVPLFIRKDTQTRAVGWGAFYRWYKWIGIYREEGMVSLWGAPTVISNKYDNFRKVLNRLIDYLQNNITINSFHINDENLPIIVKKIAKKKPNFIRGYLSALLQLAYYLDKNNITHIRPYALSTTTETLLPPYRAFLERIFGCPIYDQYGCGECGSIAFECSEHSGLHITSEHCIVEIVNENFEDAGYETGDIIVTDLDNYAMPFIRYKIGDRARLLEKKCACGLAHPLLFGIDGRSADTIVLKDGSKVHGVFFTDIIGEFNFIESKQFKRFQAYQAKEGTLEFRIEADIKLSYKNERELKNVLELYFDEVEITYYNNFVEDDSGKFRYVLSELGK